MLARYLTGVAPDAYVTEKYCLAHERTTHYELYGAFDRLLLSVALRGKFLARVADSYASVAARRSALRRKLILLVAILESCPPERGFREHTDSESVWVLSLQLFGRGLLFAFSVILGALFLLPLQALTGGVRAPAVRGGAH